MPFTLELLTARERNELAFYGSVFIDGAEFELSPAGDGSLCPVEADDDYLTESY